MQNLREESIDKLCSVIYYGQFTGRHVLTYFALDIAVIVANLHRFWQTALVIMEMIIWLHLCSLICTFHSHQHYYGIAVLG